MCDLRGQIRGQILKIREILYKISLRELQSTCFKNKWHTLIYNMLIAHTLCAKLKQHAEECFLKPVLHGEST